MDREISRKLSVFPSCEDMGPPENLEPLFPQGTGETPESWKGLRKSLLSRWKALLGSPSFGDFKREVEKVGEFRQPDYCGSVYRQPTGPETKQIVVILEPVNVASGPRPAAVVPFYHPDLMAGYSLKERRAISERRIVQFGRHLVQRGYIVACTEAFPYNTVSEPEDKATFAWWQAAADRILIDNPGWTGMGKLVWDTKLATDFLLGLDGIDNERVVMIGHSLGGKMAFCSGAMDSRVKAIIASDFGIGWRFTNWDADWYFGPGIYGKDFRLAMHQLLAVHAPNSFLLIGGQADGPASWQYISEAHKVYRLYGRQDAAGFFHHASGHRPTLESVATAYKWLAEQFDLPEQDGIAID